MLPNNQFPTYAGLQQGNQQVPGQPVLNPSSGGGTSPTAFASQPSGGGQPQPWQQQPTQPQPSLQQTTFPQPNFQPPITQPPAQQTWAPPSPTTAAPTQQPEVSPYIQELERLGHVPAGRFKNDRELSERLYSISEEMAARLEEYEKQYPTQPAATPAAPTPLQPAAAPVATATDVTQIATVFQQNGLLTFNNGQWVATNPMAAAVAEQMNRSALEAQARQAELANPSAFITKYGSEVINKAVDPLNQRLEELARQNQRLQQQFENSMPRPDRDWVTQNRSMLYAKDTTGREAETPIGAIYRNAWSAAEQQYGGNFAAIHQYALDVIKPLLPTQQQPQQKQPWLAGVQNPQSNMYAADPSFTAPGTIFNNGVSPQHQGRPLGNDGMPSFAAIQHQMSQGL